MAASTRARGETTSRFPRGICSTQNVSPIGAATCTAGAALRPYLAELAGLILQHSRHQIQVAATHLQDAGNYAHNRSTLHCITVTTLMPAQY